jgi:hypothetical protein
MGVAVVLRFWYRLILHFPKSIYCPVLTTFRTKFVQSTFPVLVKLLGRYACTDRQIIPWIELGVFLPLLKEQFKDVLLLSFAVTSICPVCHGVHRNRTMVSVMSCTILFWRMVYANSSVNQPIVQEMF